MFDPSTLLKGASILTRGLSGGPSSAASRLDNSWTSVWSSPFQVATGGGGNSASTTASATPTVGGGGGAGGYDLWGMVIPLVAIAGAVALAMTIVQRKGG